ncbi:hypothetical protein P8452_51915 [Trifolium repens]|nr:hypothetical protein P8452_51915 [Trifolium repens]
MFLTTVPHSPSVNSLIGTVVEGLNEMRVFVCCHSSFLFSDGDTTDAAVSYLLNFVSLSAIVLLYFGPLSVQFCHPNGSCSSQGSCSAVLDLWFCGQHLSEQYLRLEQKPHSFTSSEIY